MIKTLILTLLQNHVDQALNYKENPVWLFSILYPSIDRQLLRYTVQYFQQQRDQVWYNKTAQLRERSMNILLKFGMPQWAPFLAMQVWRTRTTK